MLNEDERHELIKLRREVEAIHDWLDWMHVPRSPKGTTSRYTVSARVKWLEWIPKLSSRVSDAVASWEKWE